MDLNEKLTRNTNILENNFESFINERIKEYMTEEEYLNLANSLEKLTNELLSKLGKH